MKKIEMESLYDMKNISQPVHWEDTVFYLETKMNKEKNRYDTGIQSIDVQTKERKEWGDGGKTNTAIQVSPNGKWLSYLSNNTKDEKMQLMLMPLAGGRAVQLTEEKEGVSSYKWTANGAGVYYQTNRKQGETDENEDKDEKKLPEPTVIDRLQYKLDGMGVLPQDRMHQIKKVDVASKNTQLIVEYDRPIQLNYVAKDESYLLFGDRLNVEDEWQYGGTVYWYDVAAKQARPLTTQIPDGVFQYGAMNEEEDYLLLLGNDFEYAFVSQTKVYGYDIRSQSLTCLTEEADVEVGDLLVADFQQQVSGLEVMWVNEEEFLFPATEHGKIQLYKGSREGVVEKVYDKLVHLVDGSLADDKQTLAVAVSTLVKPSELWLIDLESGEETFLYNPNEEFCRTHTFAEPERFWYKGADDWDIQGWYVPPVEAKEKHPAVLYIHGGPQVAYGESFFHEMQMLAAKGYGVIMLNPRGGNGYGQQFVASILGDYGNKDYEDLMLGTDYVLEQHPEIDQDKVYVAGGSYGGFMTNWIVGHTDRFRAAVTQRSISNWISFYGTSDIGPFFVQFQLQNNLSQVEELWKMSPLAYAENAKTPLLVIHGENDLRCPQEQGEQIYIAMKRQRVDTKLVTFPQSSHGLSREGLPNLRMERLQHIVEWFEIH
ncbi:S9 family peptidase [Atopococcus tabaci]|uniref:S9 family peptidase n=1 Tax=Atopococcus tabaci TaxID=269774 RepID=UPI0004208A4C|nr:S9 family peptidase [Atopococcus tabaci]